MKARLFILEQRHSFLTVSAVGLLIFTLPVVAEPVQVTFFGNNQFQPTGVKAAERDGAIVTVYNLDAQVNLEKQLSEGLPTSDLKKAIALARQRVGKYTPEEMAALFNGVMRAREWGVDRIPAVVFGKGSAVVYGVTDLEQALGIWNSQTSRDAGGSNP